jgi:hypothetical protein
VLVKSIQDARGQVENCWREHSSRFAASVGVIPDVFHWQYGYSLCVGTYRASRVDYRFGRCRQEQTAMKDGKLAVAEFFTIDRPDWNKVMPHVVETLRPLKDQLQFK